MNHRRSDPPRSHAALFCSIIAGVIVASGGGVSYAVFVNRQVETNREIYRVETRIKEHELEIMTIQMRTGELLNRYHIREELAQQHTTLKSIPFEAVETVRPSQESSVVAKYP